eukprot:TRINITY_DN8505_c0_g1_i2.p1 TRINITY_DN8505_c0_g1~~TRINITY_DN8505_c0_g1_i2.p1  ORF type:complete len:149 (+),score=30.62 TRINITY_DN8505_c0_g1_i2:58-447(+)
MFAKMKTMVKKEELKGSSEYQYNKSKQILPGGFVFFQCPRSSNVIEKTLGAGEKITAKFNSIAALNQSILLGVDEKKHNPDEVVLIGPGLVILETEVQQNIEIIRPFYQSIQGFMSIIIWLMVWRLIFN